MGHAVEHLDAEGGSFRQVFVVHVGGGVQLPRRTGTLFFYQNKLVEKLLKKIGNLVRTLSPHKLIFPPPPINNLALGGFFLLFIFHKALIDLAPEKTFLEIKYLKRPSASSGVCLFFTNFSRAKRSWQAPALVIRPKYFDVCAVFFF